MVVYINILYFFADIAIKPGSMTLAPAQVTEIYQDTAVPVSFIMTLSVAGIVYM